jgi:diguanylate cyclase (GGDEF)-like protein
MTATETHNILLVDDDSTIIATLGAVLQEFGRVRFARTGQEALRLAHLHPPDLVLLDIELPGMSGFEVCTAMKSSSTVADVPILFITSHDDIELEVKGLSLGASDFISKPPRPAQVAARVRVHLKMRDMHAELRRAAATDALTGLANRRQFDEYLQREWLRAKRNGAPLALLMIDVDFFKSYNDRYGHPAGDQCLRSVADVLRRVVHRPADLLARYGGEEFVILLPDTEPSGGCCVARYAVEAVRAAQLAHDGSPFDRRVTVSVGATGYERNWSRAGACGIDASDPHSTAAALVTLADRALYACKQAGRDHARFLSPRDRDSPDRALDLRVQPCQIPIPVS